MNKVSTALLGAAALCAGAVAASAQSQALRPVTDAMLQNPDPGDWLQWRRTQDSWGYSPLDQINRNNVNQLQLVWSWGINPGASEEAPLVHDGIMFIPNPGGGVQAVNAVTGDFL
jgi:alcohol dehydrogenase (cytochrome c)